MSIYCKLKSTKDTNLRIGTIMCFILGFGLYGSTFIILSTQSVLGGAHLTLVYY
jgi:DHA2 family multidrug resistance protein